LLVTAQAYGYERGPSNLVRLSEDGGNTWRILHADGRRRWLGLSRVSFADARHGWAVSHEAGQGFCSDALHVTSDGGRTWQSRSFPDSPSAFAGSRFAWAGEETAGTIWRTSDSGRTWRPSVRPEQGEARSLHYTSRNKSSL